MKKLFISLGLSSLFALSTNAATISQTFTSGQYTNFSLIIPGPVQVKQVILTGPVANTCSVQLIDAPTNSLVYTNAGFTNIISYGTNQITTWTNYYGATNSVTNVNLVDVTNTVPGFTNLYPVRIVMNAPTNGTVNTGGSINYFFNSGLWVSNVGPGSATLTVTYSQ